MSSVFITPFNFQPINTGVTSSTYTVPNGKYALVNLKNAYSPKLNNVTIYTDSNKNSILQELWVPSGSIISFSSGTVSYQEFNNTF